MRKPQNLFKYVHLNLLQFYPNGPNITIIGSEISHSKKKVCRAQQPLKTMNASGLDEKTAELLEKWTHKRVPVLYKRSELSYDSVTFPDSWMMAQIQPISKTKSRVKQFKMNIDNTTDKWIIASIETAINCRIVNICFSHI